MSDEDTEDLAAIEVDEAAEALPPLVSSVRIRRLFGRYSYSFEVPSTDQSSRLVLFYGDNGRGKTTILRLLWHLLSPSNNQSHRTRIAAVPFEAFEVDLADGTTIAATRPQAMAGPYSITVTDARDEVVSQGEWPGGSGTFAEWDLEALRHADLPRDFREEAERELSRRQYLEVLERIEAQPYFLADDRNIYSDELEERTKDRRLREQAAWRANDPRGLRDDPENSNIASELQTSMNRANDLLRQMTLGGTQSGSANANAVYLEVLTRLAAAQPEIGAAPDVLAKLRERVTLLSLRSRPFENLRLVPEFPGDRFAATLATLSPDNAGIADEVLSPFLSSLDARLDALETAQSLISTFLDESNGFLADKRMVFSPQGGLRIATQEERLTPLQLSSGERQLILLLCNALLARRSSRIFLVDEPELSLNVKWQRRIVDSLLRITDGTPVQFFIATHSVELLSNYRPNVVRLQSFD